MKITDIVSDADRWTSKKADEMAKLALTCTGKAVKEVLAKMKEWVFDDEDEDITVLTDFIMVFAQNAVFLNLNDVTKEFMCREFDDVEVAYNIIIKNRFDLFDKITKPADDVVDDSYYINVAYGLGECGLLDYTNGDIWFDWLIMNNIRAITEYALGISFIRRLYHSKVLTIYKEPKLEDILTINMGMNRISEIVGKFFPFSLCDNKFRGVVLVNSTFCTYLSNNMSDQYETVGDKFYKVGMRTNVPAFRVVKCTSEKVALK